MELQGKIINFLGDSITEGAGASSEKTRFTTLLAEKAGLARFRNYGIGGTRIAHAAVPSENPRYDLDFCGRFGEMDDNADVIVVFGGSNDYGHGTAPFGEPDDFTPDTFCGACNYLFRGLVEKYPTKTIVVMTPIQRTGGEHPNASGKKLSDYVEVILNAAARYALPVLDLYHTLGICPDIPAQKEAFTVDGLHPNDAGNALLADRLYAFLKTL